LKKSRLDGTVFNGVIQLRYLSPILTRIQDKFDYSFWDMILLKESQIV